jgi:hypothetical protein
MAFLETKTTAYKFEARENLLASSEVYGDLTDSTVKHLPEGDVAKADK